MGSGLTPIAHLRWTDTSSRIYGSLIARDLEQAFRAVVAPTPVTLIAHDLKFVNREIRMGQYFFSDIANQGILLYAGERLDFAKPKALNDRERLALGEHNFGYWFHSASE